MSKPPDTPKAAPGQIEALIAEWLNPKPCYLCATRHYPGLCSEHEAKRKCAEQLRAVLAAQPVAAPPCPRKEVGNVLDNWDQLSNDIRSDPGFDRLNAALHELYDAVTREAQRDG